MENDEGETVRRQVRVTGEHPLLKDDPSMFVLLFSLDEIYSFSIEGYFSLIMRILIELIIFVMN